MAWHLVKHGDDFAITFIYCRPCDAELPNCTRKTHCSVSVLSNSIKTLRPLIWWHM